MRKFSPVKFIVVLIAILFTIRIVRYIPIAPVILVIIVASMARNQRKRYEKAAEEHREEEKDYTEKHDSNSTIITCDYCGSKVDTSKHAVCDHCGGPYWDDDEWKTIRNRRMNESQERRRE